MKTITADDVRKKIGYDPETGKFFRIDDWGSRKAGAEPGSMSKCGYLQIGVCGRTHTAQRLAWLLHYGEWPEGVIDHINRDKLDNRIANLRCVKRTYNAHNTGPRLNNKTGQAGVCKKQNKRRTPAWEASIKFGGIYYYLGIYPTLEEAIIARKAAEERLMCKP